MAVLPAVIVALLATSSNPLDFLGIVICAALIALVGLSDDLFDIPALVKLAGQLAVAIVAVLFGVQISVISNPFGGVIELNSLLGCVYVDHLADWDDERHQPLGRLGRPGSRRGTSRGIDHGCSVCPIGGICRWHCSDWRWRGPSAGFLPFNAYNAKLILGDSGSNLLGFLIGSLAILGQAKIGTALLVLGIPILDVAWTIVRRQRSGRGITSRDTQHLHHRLVDAGLTHPQVTMIYVFAVRCLRGIGITFGTSGEIGRTCRTHCTHGRHAVAQFKKLVQETTLIGPEGTCF